MRKSFRTRLRSEGPGGAWTYLQVPFSVEKVFGSRARVSVCGTINGFAFRNSVFPTGKGTHVMMVNRALQAGAGAKPGAMVRVVMAPDTAPRVVRVAPDFKRAIAKNARAKASFDAFSPSHKKAYVEFVETAKRPETRARRIARSVSMLARGLKRM